MKTRRIVSLLAMTGWIALGQQASAVTNFYASYNNNLNLDIGASPVPSSSDGLITIVPGFAVRGVAGNAAHFSGNTSWVNYASSGTYVPDFGIATVGSNTFRMLFKPDFSGNPTAFRANFLGIGGLGFGDGIFLAHSDAGFPAFRVTINTVFKDNVLSGFSWDANTWYYLGASLDASGSLLYVRALTNGALPNVSTLSFGTSTNWSGLFGFNSTPLRVSGRYDVNTEGARGTLDDIFILNGEKWNVSDFNHDFAVIIPEPSGALLVLGALLALWRLRK